MYSSNPDFNGRCILMRPGRINQYHANLTLDELRSSMLVVPIERFSEMGSKLARATRREPRRAC